MQVAAWPEFMRNYNGVLQAMHSVFAALDSEEQQRGAAGAGGTAAAGGSGAEPRQSVVSPNSLREALSSLPGKIFRTGGWRPAFAASPGLSCDPFCMPVLASPSTFCRREVLHRQAATHAG